jgi:hypothetical protein
LKVIEIYDSTAHLTKLQTYFANRFLLELSGENISSSDLLYQLLDRINLDGLRAIVGPVKGSNEK